MNYQSQLMRLCILVVPVFLLSACYTFMDMSREGRQKMWLEWVRDGALGKNMYECKNLKSCSFLSAGYAAPISRQLSNGNTEEENQYGHPLGRCRYFYEYETDTGRIVGFRFKESEQYGCRIAGG